MISTVAAGAGFAAYLAGSAVMGISCGTGCSPAISMFLGSYVFHSEGDTRQTLLAFLKFFAGKATAVLVVCLAAAAAGGTLLSEGGYFGKYKLTFLMPLFLICTGLYMLRKCWREFRHKGCGSCEGGCGHTLPERIQNASALIGGFVYGLTPCAPLIILAGYAVTMPIVQALTLGIVFSAACTISPLLLMLVLTKMIAVQMLNEVPVFFNILKIILSAGVLVIGCMTLFTGIDPSI